MVVELVAVTGASIDALVIDGPEVVVEPIGVDNAGTPPPKLPVAAGPDDSPPVRGFSTSWLAASELPTRPASGLEGGPGLTSPWQPTLSNHTPKYRNLVEREQQKGKRTERGRIMAAAGSEAFKSESGGGPGWRRGRCLAICRWFFEGRYAGPTRTHRPLDLCALTAIETHGEIPAAGVQITAEDGSVNPSSPRLEDALEPGAYLRSTMNKVSRAVLRRQWPVWNARNRATVTYGALAWNAFALVGVSGCSSRQPILDEATLPDCPVDASRGFTEDVSQPTSAAHTELPQTYDDKPPMGGPHSGCWGTWGIHDVPLRAERFVHNLEHGGVVLLYNCPDGCEKEVTWLQEFTSDHELTILTEYSALSARFGLSAWNARAYSDCLSPDFVRDFYERRVDRAPERFSRPPPEPPASCAP